MEIGSEGGIDIMHVWSSQFIWMKMGWSVMCVRACVCKLTDVYTNGIGVYSACEVSWYVMEGEQTGSDSKECAGTVDTHPVPADSQSFLAASLKMPLSYQGCLASKQASGHRAKVYISKGVMATRRGRR